MDIKQGEIFWIEQDEPLGSEPAYRHPHVVIQNNVFNLSKIGTVVICGLTTNLRRATDQGSVPLKKRDGGVPKDCVVNVSQIITVSKQELTEDNYIGILPRKTVNKIISGIRLLIEPKDI